MRKLWPWSKGAPVFDEHNELEEEMNPDPEVESEIYDLQSRSRGDTKEPQPRRPDSRK